jgi:hypothetical protein
MIPHVKISLIICQVYEHNEKIIGYKPPTIINQVLK